MHCRAIDPCSAALGASSLCSIYVANVGRLGENLAQITEQATWNQIRHSARALRRLRTQRKWSQTVLALRADVDRNYISLIELGRNSPSVRMVFRLCDALDITPSDLLKEVERRLGVQRPNGF